MKKLPAFALLSFIVTTSWCQKKKQGHRAARYFEGNIDSSLFSKLQYRLVGPFRGGRSGAVTEVIKNKTRSF